MKDKLLAEMVRAIEVEHEKELQWLIAKMDKEAAIKAYREYEDAEECQNLKEEPVGEGK